jgi:hypothetical protein
MNTTSTANAAFPDGIDVRHVERLAGWRHHASPLSLGAFGMVVLLALFGVFGHERRWEADTGGTRLSVQMPETIRNGEFFEIRVEVESDASIGELVIGIDQALWEDMTINTLIPAATDESAEDGEFRFTFGGLAAGTPFLLKVDAQVNPDILGGNEGVVTVYDGEVAVTELPVAMTVLP